MKLSTPNYLFVMDLSINFMTVSADRFEKVHCIALDVTAG